MTTVILRQDSAVTTTSESVWGRLHRIAESRRLHLHLTQEGVRAAGGPSVSWQTKLPKKTETPGPRHVEPLRQLDRALQWPDGTSMRLLTEDRTGWSRAVLEDEELSLVEGQDEIAHLAFMVDRRLRTLDPPEREQMMRDVGRAIGLPVVGD